jgi:hypothetical protein
VHRFACHLVQAALQAHCSAAPALLHLPTRLQFLVAKLSPRHCRVNGVQVQAKVQAHCSKAPALLYLPTRLQHLVAKLSPRQCSVNSLLGQAKLQAHFSAAPAFLHLTAWPQPLVAKLSPHQFSVNSVDWTRRNRRSPLMEKLPTLTQSQPQRQPRNGVVSVLW